MSKTRTVPQLDSEGRFIGETVAEESPLEPGVFLIPTGAVDAPRPVIPAGFFARWDGRWVLEKIPAPVVPEPEPEVLPALSPAQFWMQLAIDGDEAAALAIIDTLPRPQQILATKAKDYRIDDPLLLQLAAALGKNESQIDAFFRRAVKL